jgi:hypothetical protein
LFYIPQENINPFIILGIIYPNIIAIQGLKFRNKFSNKVHIRGKMKPGIPHKTNINNLRNNILV